MFDEIKEQLEFEYLDGCPVCKSNCFRIEFKREYASQIFQWARCKNCFLLFQNPRLAKRSLHMLFNSLNYWEGGRLKDARKAVSVYFDYLSGEDFRLKQAKQRIKDVVKFVPPPARLLEIGCATGSFIKVAREHGYYADGIEISKEIANWANQRYGLQIRTEDFEEAPVKDSYYDVAVMWGADGCFRDPVNVHKKINKSLKANGYLIFNFFDFDHFTKIFRGNFKKVPSAVCNFNKKSLVLLLDKTGFDIVKLQPESQYASLEKIFSLLGKTFLLKIVNGVGLDKKIVRIPTFCGYLVVAKKTKEI